MKKLICTFLLLLALGLTSAAHAEALLDEDGLRLVLTSWTAAPGEAVLELQCANDDPAARELLFLMPQVNGQPAGFEYGWGSCLLELPGASEQAFTLVLLTDDPDELPESLCLRCALEGRISSPASLALEGDAAAVTAASFALGAAEPPLLAPEATVRGDPNACRRTLSDALTPEQTALLDYGRALICVRDAGEDGDRLTHICSVEAVVDREGQIRADYSGLALALADDAAFLIPTEESADPARARSALGALAVSLDLSGQGRPTQTASVSLSGEAAFFASLSFTLRQDENGLFRVEDTVVSSSEIGGDCTVVPCALFDTAQTSPEVWRVEAAETDGAVRLTRDAGPAVQRAVSAPLQLRLFPAAELGELVVCFEYFFTDGSDIEHAPVRIE